MERRRRPRWVPRIPWVLGAIPVLVWGSSPLARAAERALPVRDGKQIVASVDGHAITLDELDGALGDAGTGDGKSASEVSRARWEALNRLIHARLILLEASRIGLDELPEVKKNVEAFSRVTLRELLMERVGEHAAVEDGEVDAAYREAIREWKVTSLLFQKEDDAKKLAAELRAGKTLDDLADKAVREGKARGGKNENYVKGKDILPQLAEVLAKARPGEVSGPIETGSGYAIVRLDEERFPDDAATRERVRGELLADRRRAAVRRYIASLFAKYAVVDEEKVKEVDFEKDPEAFDELLKDTTVLAEIEGEAPVTVGDLARAIQGKMFHGVRMAISSKRVNDQKLKMLDETVAKRVLSKEALRIGLEETEPYRMQVRQFKDSRVFGVFIEKVVAPDIKIGDAERREYYRAHIAEYSSPETLETDCLVFAKEADATAALEKLRGGTSPSWLKAHAEGQVGLDSPGRIECEEATVARGELPEGVAGVLEGAQKGEFRLFASPEGWFYVYHVADIAPSKPRAYEEVAAEVGRKLFDAKLEESVEEWGKKLRRVSEVEVYLARPGK